MLFFGKKPSISQKACWAESAWRKVSPAVLDAGSRAYAAFASSPCSPGVPGGRARRASWAGRAVRSGRHEAMRNGRGGAKWRQPWFCGGRIRLSPRAVDVRRGVAVQL